MNPYGEIDIELDLPWLIIGCSRCGDDISGFYDPDDPPYYCEDCESSVPDEGTEGKDG